MSFVDAGAGRLYAKKGGVGDIASYAGLGKGVLDFNGEPEGG